MFCNCIASHSMSCHCPVCVRLSHSIKDYLLTCLIYSNTISPSYDPSFMSGISQAHTLCHKKLLLLWWSASSRNVDKICPILLRSVITLWKIMSMFNLMHPLPLCWLCKTWLATTMTAAFSSCVVYLCQDTCWLYHIFSTAAATWRYYPSGNIF